MISDELKQYPEFEGLDEMNEIDAAAYLMKLAKRYSTIADLAKKTAFNLVADSNTPTMVASDGTAIKIVTKSLSKVDVPTLKECYPQEYLDICNAGDVSISTKALKGFDVKGVTTTTVSRYLELCR